ncbi:MAG: TolC family protein [Verrucomicrobiota bacterium]
MKDRLFAILTFVILKYPLPAAAEPEEWALSLFDCIDLAIQHNLDFESNLKNPEIAAQEVRIARAAFHPDFSANANLRDATSPGGVDSQTNQLFTGTQTAREPAGSSLGGSLPTGATWSLSANNPSTDVTNRGNSFNNENGFVSVEFRQPLLRNRAINSNRLGIQLSDLALLDSESQQQNQLMNLVTNVEFAYYNLIAARDRLTIFQHRMIW